jgi:hypothetical protein
VRLLALHSLQEELKLDVDTLRSSPVSQPASQPASQQGLSADTGGCMRLAETQESVTSAFRLHTPLPLPLLVPACPPCSLH